MKPLIRSLDHESVLIPESFGVGLAITPDHAAVAIQLLDKDGDDWTIIFEPHDAYRLILGLLGSYAELSGIALPEKPTDEQVRRLMGENP